MDQSHATGASRADGTSLPPERHHPSPPMCARLPVHDRTRERRRTEPRWLRPSIVRDVSVSGALPAMD